MDSTIKDKLREMEQACNVKILYACESGSRAWGFPSPDSDYDVRFIYVHPKEYYLSVDEQRDVIEVPINDLLDINGWELRKALRLFKKSNAPFYEWLQSPIVYSQNNEFAKDLKNLMPQYFSPRATMHHYLSMANSVVDVGLSGHEVKLKKYFYALRPALAARWILDYNEVPPMEFGKLRSLLDYSLNGVMDELLAKKAQVDERYLMKPLMELHLWLGNQLGYCEERVPPASPAPDTEPLNELFRKFVV
jgi:uncharacterized protein